LLPSTWRSCDTWLCSVFSTVGGALSPHTTSASWLTLTIWPLCKASVASTALRRSPGTGRRWLSDITSTGPSSRTCMTPRFHDPTPTPIRV